MRNKVFFALLLAAALCLSACSNRPDMPPVPTALPQETQVSATPTPTPSETPVPTPEPTPVPTPTPEPTPPPHSEFYIPDLPIELVLEYFEEVVLNVEYTDGTGDATLVQKWLEPIYYRIYGTATDEDLEVLNTLFEQLNAVSGFPGIHAAEDGKPENLKLNFLARDAFNESFSQVINGEEAYGAVHFWYYTDSNQLYDARIGYRTDIDQFSRSSILIEEIINGLGITDTVLRSDSIVYQYSNSNTALSEIDWLILKLLYHPAMKCGMDAESCEAVIRELYY